MAILDTEEKREIGLATRAKDSKMRETRQKPVNVLCMSTAWLSRYSVSYKRDLATFYTHSNLVITSDFLLSPNPWFNILNGPINF